MYYPEWNLLNLSIVFIAIAGSIALIVREFSPSTRLSYSKFNTTSLKASSGIPVSDVAYVYRQTVLIYL